MDEPVTPAEQLAALRALSDALAVAIDQVKIEVQAAMDSTGADRYRTELGPVYQGVGASKIIFDEDRLLAFAQDSDLDGVEVQVRQTFRNLFKIDDGDVIFTPTGEAIEWAKIRPGTRYVAAKLTPEAKQRAQQLLTSKVELVGQLIEFKEDGS